MARKSGLGRGLDSLIPIGVLEETEEVEREVADRKAARERAANKAERISSTSNDANEKNSAKAQKIDAGTEIKKETKQGAKTKTSGASRSTKQAKEKVNTKPGTKAGPSTKENGKPSAAATADSSEKTEQIQNGEDKPMADIELLKEDDKLSEPVSVLQTGEKAEPEQSDILNVVNPVSEDTDTMHEPDDAAPAADMQPEANTGTVTLKLTDIEPNREQPRKEFNEDALQELADSIKIHGVIQPLLVQKKGEYYEIIAGERRWRAAKIAGLREVPVVIREYTPREVMEVSLIENIQREDLNAIEEAKAYQRLIQEFHLKQEEIAVKISKSRTAIANTMRLLKLDERVQTMLIEDEISSGHARALLPLEDGDLQYQAAQKIASESLSVRETEKLVKLLLMPPKEETPKEEARDDSFIYRALEEKMKTIMGTKVTIHKKDNNKGRIEIEYYSPEELERITDLIETIRQG